VFVIAGAMVCVSAASAADKVGTRVTLDNIEITPGGTIWTGDIFSSKKSCKNKRTATLVGRANVNRDCMSVGEKSNTISGE
jgi:hypothetical protein